MPIVVEVVDQRRFRKYAFEPQFVAKKPDQTATGGDDGILIQAAAQTDDSENFVFLERERDEDFPRNIKAAAADAVLEVKSRIKL